MLAGVEGAKVGREVGLIPHDEEFALICGLESQHTGKNTNNTQGADDIGWGGRATLTLGTERK